MLYNPAMLRKMEFVDIGRCNARQNFRHFFVIFLPFFFCQNGKNYPISLAWFFALTADAPHFIQAPLPPSIEKQVQKVHLRNQKRFLVKKFLHY